ncbi:MAG: TGS domain-containing protein, partial [Actinomycetes bacterium]
MSAQITVVVDGAEQSVDSSTTGADLFKGAAFKDVVVARVNGELKDLDQPLAEGDVVEPVRTSEPEGLAVLRHSAAHVLAQAVQAVFPETSLGIGPPVKDGFYYDFD